jgi:hypothetical protein
LRASSDAVDQRFAAVVECGGELESEARAGGDRQVRQCPAVRRQRRRTGRSARKHALKEAHDGEIASYGAARAAQEPALIDRDIDDVLVVAQIQIECRDPRTAGNTRHLLVHHHRRSADEHVRRQWIGVDDRGVRREQRVDDAQRRHDADGDHDDRAYGQRSPAAASEGRNANEEPAAARAPDRNAAR